MGEGKTQHGIYIPESPVFSATTARLNPHRVQERTVLSEDPGMSPGQKCGAVELRLNLSYQRLEAGLNQSRKIPGNQGGVNGNHDCTGFQHNHHKEPPTSSPRTPPPPRHPRLPLRGDASRPATAVWDVPSTSRKAPEL